MTDRQAIDRALQSHYAHGELASAIDRSLVKLGKDPANLTVDDLAMIDEFHIGGRPASLELFEQCKFDEGMHLLDVGSGLGGPARTCAAAKSTTVTGVDLTPEYVAAATDLSQRVGLSARTTFKQGSVLDLPFADGTFDGAYMIHVGMN
ncbi:MAG: class I SAM-dependent methyltransferase, partial [Hyphomicrobiaceae bacterium]